MWIREHLLLGNHKVIRKQHIEFMQFIECIIAVAVDLHCCRDHECGHLRMDDFHFIQLVSGSRCVRKDTKLFQCERNSAAGCFQSSAFTPCIVELLLQCRIGYFVVIFENASHEFANVCHHRVCQINEAQVNRHDIVGILIDQLQCFLTERIDDLIIVVPNIHQNFSGFTQSGRAVDFK